MMRAFTVSSLLQLLLFFDVWWGPKLLADAAASSTAMGKHPKCAKEFEDCYFRDCCGAEDGELTCVQGGSGMVLYINKNSTCFSDRSLALATKSNTEKRDMLLKFYEELVAPEHRKSTDQVNKMFEKHQNEFPQLVTRLEHRYKISFIGVEENYGSEL